MRVKNSRWARFMEMASTVPSMIRADHRIHGALDLRQGVAVVKRESDRQKKSENKLNDFLIMGANTYSALAVQGTIYRAYYDGRGTEGEFKDPNSVKPLSNGDNFGKLEHMITKMNEPDNAISMRDTVRPIMSKFERDNEWFLTQQGFIRLGLGSGLARLQQQLHSNDAFDILMGPGIDRDYPSIAHNVQLLGMDLQQPIGNLRDSTIGQMVRGKSKHSSRTVRMMYHKDIHKHTEGVGFGAFTNKVKELW